MDNTELYDRIVSLPSQVKEEVLDFMDYLLEKKKKQDTGNKTFEKLELFPQRKLGVLKNRASFRIKENFAMTDEELLSV